MKNLEPRNYFELKTVLLTTLRNTLNSPIYDAWPVEHQVKTEQLIGSLANAADEQEIAAACREFEI